MESVKAIDDPELLEKDHVHHVYDIIAPHFNVTRYKPWPIVNKFLLNVEKGSVIADVGCGNGIYLNVNSDCYAVGLDRNEKLLSICNRKGHNVISCDQMRLPFKNNYFDHVISIAVIHHFASEERRSFALRELWRILKPQGTLLVFVWAKEKDETSRKGSADVLIPWNLQKEYYREATSLHQITTSISKSSGIETTNAIIPPPTKFDQLQENTTPTLPRRYYHLFCEGELERLVHQSLPKDGFRILSPARAYDYENWYIILEKLQL